MISVTNESYRKLTVFPVRKDEWNTKEGAVKSIKITLYVQWYDKKHLFGWSDIEQSL